MQEPRHAIDGQLAVQSRLHDDRFGLGEFRPFLGCCCDPINAFREGDVDAVLIHVLAGRAPLGLAEELCPAHSLFDQLLSLRPILGASDVIDEVERREPPSPAAKDIWRLGVEDPG